MNSATTLSCAALGFVLAFLARDAGADPVTPSFGDATFVPGAPVDHPYFPLFNDGKTRVFTAEGADERFELTVVGAGPTIGGVQTTSRRDRAFEEGLLVEDTFDFFAQDTAGNVWYFGEDVTNYEYDAHGNLIGTNDESAWRAFQNGALPGFIMPADLSVGFNYYQENSPNDDALDQATTFAMLASVTVAVGTFNNVLQVLETTEVEPNAREFKYYAPGAGLILAEEGLDTNLQNPELSFQLVAVVPEPANAALLLAGLVVLAVGARGTLFGARRI